MNIVEGLAHAVKVAGNRPAISCGETEYTWSQFAFRTDCLAHGLAQFDVKRGDRVAVLMLNCHRYLELYYTCARMGVVIVPLNIRLAPSEITFILNDSQTSVLIVDQRFASFVSKLEQPSCIQHLIYSGPSTGEAPVGMHHYEHLVQQGTTRDSSGNQQIGDEELFGLFYTGGTTGRVKGVMLSQKNFVSNAMHAIMAFGIDSRDAYLHAAPMFHIGDLAATFALTMMGGQHIFLPTFQPQEVLQAIQRQRVTITTLVPTMINAVLHHPEVDQYDVSSLHTVIYGASPMPIELLKRGLSKWGQVFVHVYGMTEAAGYLTTLPQWDHIRDGTLEQEHRLSSCGKQILGVEVRVVTARGENVQPDEVGEIIARGPNVMLGYWQQPEVTAEATRDGWFHTGDLATVDEEHYISIVDRAKDMIISGGENIYSVEVEQVLSRHLAVLEAAVIGIPHDHWGEAVHAVVVCKSGMQVSSDELIAHARTQLAGYKVPRSIEIRAEALPKSGPGKILKRELREPYWVGKSRNVN
ncbi:MAG: long-chain-fatty-acid--CoA ligase [Ktedonobacteraceae bacterium]|nr:long-chain-fatty-acid--CoA ligase [Ktedonobacteraceae bacterium]